MDEEDLVERKIGLCLQVCGVLGGMWDWICI